MTTSDAMRLRHSTRDDFGFDIVHMANDDTYPCRHCLQEASGRTGMLLLSYQTPAPHSVYGHPTAVFLCAAECERFDAPDTTAPIVANRHVSLRAFSANGLMIYDANRLVAPAEDHGLAIKQTFERLDVAYINAHTAKAGCMLSHIARI